MTAFAAATWSWPRHHHSSPTQRATTRAPICLDTDASTFESLTNLLQTCLEDGAGWTDVGSVAARQVGCMVLRRLRACIEIPQPDLSEEAAARLHALLRSCLAHDPRLHPHCAELCEHAAKVMSAGQCHFFPSPHARAVTAYHLVEELLKQPIGAASAACGGCRWQRLQQRWR